MQKDQRKVNFKISHCTSQEPQYPASQLLLQSMSAKGWQSKRFSTYPQIIIIQLLEPTILRKISFLSHQSKIATRIEIESKVEQHKEWKKLGFASLKSNQESKFSQRQLRTANLNGTLANHIKLIFRQNHVNDQNIFNQVGIITFSVYGDKAIQSYYGNQNHQNHQNNQNQPQNSQKNIQGLQLDKVTATKLKELQIRKKQAVQNQNFDQAQQLKHQIDRIKQIGQTLILLEQKKQQAIKNQDYEAAKIIKQQMEKMRDDGQQGQNQTTKTNAGFNKQQNKPVHERQQQQRQSVSPISNQKQANKVGNQRQALTKNEPQPKQMNKPQVTQQKKAPIHDQDRPLDIKGGNSTQNIPNQYAEQQEPEGNGELQQLSKEILNLCNQYFDVIDEEIFRHIFSKDHKNRENGIRMIKDKFKQKLQDRQTFIQAVLFAIKSLIDDRIASVLVTTLQTFDQFMRKFKPHASSNNIQHAQFILQKMSDYLGHTNQKIRSLTQSTYSSLPLYQLTSKDLCYTALTQTYKRQKPPKILTGKLRVVARIIKDYQLGKNYQHILNYAVKYFDDKNNEVRNAAISVVVNIAKEIGYQSVQPFLKGVKSQIINLIQEQIDGDQQADDRNFDQKPIKQVTKGKSQKSQIQSENQFISIPTKKSQSKNEPEQNPAQICIYCGKFDQRFGKQNYIDMHYFHSCPMLVMCLECHQIIDIASLTSHLMGQCQNSKYYKKCPRCKEAVHQKNYKEHTQKKQCLSAKPLAAAQRCPLCHLDIGTGPGAWKVHLVDEGCDNNPRK